MSKIEWTDETWNPTTECTRVSAGCDNCYAVKMTNRLATMAATKEKYGGLINEGKDHFNGVVKCHEDELSKPMRWRKPRKIFVNSMSDLFHEGVPFEFVDKVFAVMALCPQHTFQILTKRPERMAEYLSTNVGHRIYQNCISTWLDDGKDGFLGKAWDQVSDLAGVSVKGGHFEIMAWNLPLPNVWLGTSVENQKTADERIPHLLRCPAVVRFLSCEPLLGEVDLLRAVMQCGEYFCPSCSEFYDEVGKDMSCESCGEVFGDDYDGDECRCGGSGTEVQCPKCERFGDDDGLDATECWTRTIEVVYLPSHLHWIITGGESGPGARPCNIEDIRSIVQQSKAAGVPVYVKQMGAKPIMNGKPTGDFRDGPRGRQFAMTYDVLSLKDRKGGDPSEWPDDLRAQEMPAKAEVVG